MLESTNILKESTRILINGFNNRLEEKVKEGLQLKGYEFEDNDQFISFIKAHVKRLQQGSRTFWTVKSEPFMVTLGIQQGSPTIESEDPYKISLSMNYQFL